jgi:hypothetical protein
LLSYQKNGPSLITEFGGIHGEKEIKKIPSTEEAGLALNSVFGPASFVRFYQKELVYVEGVSEQNMIWQFYKMSYVRMFLSADSSQEFKVQLYPNVKFGPRPPEWNRKKAAEKDGWILWKDDKSSPTGSFTQLTCEEVK